MRKEWKNITRCGNYTWNSINYVLIRNLESLNFFHSWTFRRDETTATLYVILYYVTPFWNSRTFDNKILHRRYRQMQSAFLAFLEPAKIERQWSNSRNILKPYSLSSSSVPFRCRNKKRNDPKGIRIRIESTTCTPCTCVNLWIEPFYVRILIFSKFKLDW